MSTVSGMPLELAVFEKGFNFSQDGPGNRLVLHLQGCNLHCPWCSNPEGLSLCPQSKHRAEVRTVDDWFAFVASSSPMFFSGGGLTLTGGEVGMQLEGAAALLKRCREAKIHTAIETNLSVPGAPELYPYLSLLIADYKHFDDGVLHSVCGADAGIIERNLCTALDSGLPVIARIPLIHGFNAEEGYIPGFIGAFKRIAAHDRGGQLSVELLTYHEFGKDKWAKCGLIYEMKDGFVQPGVYVSFRNAFVHAGFHVIST